jgi:enterochelin esterase-like enzyme
VSNTILFKQYLLKDVIPVIESGYRVVANADSRAIAGMSMGGNQARAIAFGRPELFGSNRSPGSFHAG